MALRLALMGLVGLMGLEPPTSGQVEEWVGEVRCWVVEEVGAWSRDDELAKESLQDETSDSVFAVVMSEVVDELSRTSNLTEAKRVEESAFDERMAAEFAALYEGQVKAELLAQATELPVDVWAAEAKPITPPAESVAASIETVTEVVSVVRDETIEPVGPETEAVAATLVEGGEEGSRWREAWRRTGEALEAWRAAFTSEADEANAMSLQD